MNVHPYEVSFNYGDQGEYLGPGVRETVLMTDEQSHAMWERLSKIDSLKDLYIGPAKGISYSEMLEMLDENAEIAIAENRWGNGDHFSGLVECTFCGGQEADVSARKHQDGLVCVVCWDDRLSATT